MHEYSSDSPSILLHNYLEGDLDPDRESLLFETLAGNTDLRSEMRALLRIRALTRADADTIVPPGALRGRVLQAVGAPLTASVAPTAPPWYTQRIVLSLLSALTATLLTLVLVRPVDPSTAEVTVNRSSEGASGPLERSVDGESNGGRPAAIVQRTPVAEPTRSVFEPTAISSSDRRSWKRSTVPASVDSMPAESRREPAEAASIVEPSVTRSAAFESEAPATDVGIDRAAAPLEALRSSTMDADESVGKEWELSVRGFASEAYPSISGESQSDPFFNDMSIALSHAVSSESMVGIEVGQQAFAQQYEGSEGGRPVRIRQNPLLLWGGAFYETRLGGDIVPQIHPYGRLFVGGTTVGPTARLSSGVRYRPDARVTFMLGVEGTVLAYRFQGRWFDSRALGVTYGVALSF